MVFIIYNAKDWSAQNGKYYNWALPACVSTVSLPYVTHMIRSPGLPLHICAICVLQDWRWERPGTRLPGLWVQVFLT